MSSKIKEMLNCKTIKELKDLYKKLAFVYHPDMGGNTSDMQDLNNVYESMHETLKNNMDTESYEYKQASKENVSDYMNLIYDIVNVKGIDIEVIGTWLWIGTKKISPEDYLYMTSLGFKWSKSKQRLYKDTLRTKEDMDELYKNKWKHRGKKLNDIRNKYGSINIDTSGYKEPEKIL